MSNDGPPGATPTPKPGAQRLTARDYKRSPRGDFSLEWQRWRGFAIGLGAGLIVAGIVYVADHRAPDAATQAAGSVPHRSSAGSHSASEVEEPDAPRGGVDAATDPSSNTRYDFYEMLPNFEVVVPERERGAHVAAAVPINRPGIYFLQVGSYRDESEAERVRAKLGKLGIAASVQRVAVDTDVRFRVRVGPIHELPQLNHLRSQLAASDLDSLVIRVGD